MEKFSPEAVFIKLKLTEFFKQEVKSMKRKLIFVPISLSKEMEGLQ